MKTFLTTKAFFATILTTIFTLLLYVMPYNTCQANNDYIDGFHENYTYIENYRGTIYYLDMTSITSVEYKPPYYKLAAGILINYPDGRADYRIYTWKYIYNTAEKRRMYIMSEDNSLSQYIPRYDEKSLDSTIIFLRPAGELAWEEYYKTIFYVK